MCYKLVQGFRVTCLFTDQYTGTTRKECVSYVTNQNNKHFNTNRNSTRNLERGSGNGKVTDVI